MNQLLFENALWCKANLNFSFTPVNGKIPVAKGWQSADIETQDQLQSWVAQGFNLSVRTGSSSGGILVVDLDRGKSDYDPAAVDALGLPQTVEAVTPSGGAHLYYKLPENCTLKNSANKLAPCVDTRCEKGAAVFPGSIREDGAGYHWQPGKEPWSIPLAVLPDAIVEALKPREMPAMPRAVVAYDATDKRQANYVKKAFNEELDIVAGTKEGGRNHQLNESVFKIAGFISGGYLTIEDVSNNFLAAALSCGLGQAEAEKTIRGAIRDGMSGSRGVPEQTGGAERSEAASRVPNKKSPGFLGVRAPLNPPAPQGEEMHVTHDINPTAVGAVLSSIMPDVLNEHDEVNLGHRDPETDELVLDPHRTLPTADAFIRDFATIDNCRIVHYYKKDFYIWEDNAYRPQDPERLTNLLLPWLHYAVYYGEGRPGKRNLKSYPTTSGKVLDVASAILSRSLVPGTYQMPCYLSGDNSKPDPKEILSCKNQNLHVPTMKVLPKDPDLFSANALDFDYDANAPKPKAWMDFLQSVWTDDPEAIQLLKEWFGYCLTADTSQQKILLVKGPKRSGKGTIAKILQALVGRANFAGMQTGTFATNFGLEMLVGKSVACFSDARFGGKDMQTIVERLLTISGEDTVMIDRKGIKAVTVRLPLKMMFLTNELPNLRDSAGALQSRFILLLQKNSFLGKEDKTLEARLMNELPGILLWALEGWHDLNKRGYFIVPKSSEHAQNDLNEMGSPVKAFIAEKCVVNAECSVVVQHLYDAYLEWAEKSGVKHTPTKAHFGKDLTAAEASVVRKQKRMEGQRMGLYEGIGLGEFYPHLIPDDDQ